MMRTHALLKLWLLAIYAASFLTGCEDDEKEPGIEVAFTSRTGDVGEGDTLVVELALKEPVKKTEYITFSVKPSEAEFGVDFGINNLFELADNSFTVKVSPNSTAISFYVIALEDFETESLEKVEIEIDEMTEGLISGSETSFTVNIANVPNHQVGNRAILFDGIDDYIDLGNIYDDLALPVTISSWVWLDPTAPDGVPIPIFDSQDGLPLYNGFNLLTSKASIAGVQYGDGLGENHSVYRRAKSASFSPVAGRWVNFTAVVKGAADMSIYFNGVDVGGEYYGESNQPMHSDSPTEVAKIGYLYQNGVVLRFKGKIDELKIWNRALTLVEIQKTIFVRSPSSEPGLIGYWNFDEATGETVLDHSINGFDGTIKGNAARVLSEVPVR